MDVNDVLRKHGVETPKIEEDDENDHTSGRKEDVETSTATHLPPSEAVAAKQALSTILSPGSLSKGTIETSFGNSVGMDPQPGAISPKSAGLSLLTKLESTVRPSEALAIKDYVIERFGLEKKGVAGESKKAKFYKSLLSIAARAVKKIGEVPIESEQNSNISKEPLPRDFMYM